jgi:hypothetical protein
MNGPGYGYKRMEGLPDPATNEGIESWYGNKRMDRVRIRNSQINQIQIKKQMDRLRIRNSHVNQIQIRQEMKWPGPDTQFTNDPDPDTAINKQTTHCAVSNRWTGTGSGYVNSGWIVPNFYYLFFKGDNILTQEYWVVLLANFDIHEIITML